MTKQKYLNSLDDIKLTKEFVFLNPYKFIAYFIYIIIAVLIGVCVFLFFTNKQETVDTQGTLQLVGKVQDLQVLTDGVVEQVHVKDGEYVEKGQTIFSLQSDKLTAQKGEYEKQIAQTEQQLAYAKQLEDCINYQTNTFLNNEEQSYFYAQAQNFLAKIAALRSSSGGQTVATLTQQRNEYQDLLSAMENETNLPESHALRMQQKLFQSQMSNYDDMIRKTTEILNQANALHDITAAAQYQQQLETYKSERQSYKNQQMLSVQQQISSLNQQITQSQNSKQETAQQSQSEIEQLTASSLVEVQSQKQQLQTKIDEYKANLSMTEADLRQCNIQATESGYVYYKTDVKKDTTLSAGSIVGIVTTQIDKQDQDFRVTMYVPSKGIGFVEIGQNVKLSVDGLDTSEYGYINGTVTKIYETPVQTENAMYYQVEATLDPQGNESVYKELFALKDNMTISAKIVKNETNWLFYLLQKINILKDSDTAGTTTGSQQQS